jgi:ribose 5-phosphate isomerase B
MSREHNDANMLALGTRVVGGELAKMIVEAWLNGEYQHGRHQNRLDMISQIEQTGALDV